jgi:Zn-dependent M28 family amino/carboxypeptidase
MSRRSRRVWLSVVGITSVVALSAWATMIRMPGTSFEGPLPALTDAQRATSERLRADVTALATDIGERNFRRYDELERAAAFVEASFEEQGLAPARQVYSIDGRDYANVEVEIPGRSRPSEIVIVGAHYDSALGSPGANDNGTGVAALLELARRMQGQRPARTLRLVAFVNEEMPHFANGTMGSQEHARRAKNRGEKVVAMISLETIGYYSDRPGSQQYPFPVGMFYPDRGDFLGFVGNVGSRELVRRAIAAFRTHARFPSEGAALPSAVPGVGWSDHASFWEAGYPAIMLTDTAPFRYPHYHPSDDTPDKIDFERTARVVDGVEAIVLDLCEGAR